MIDSSFIVRNENNKNILTTKIKKNKQYLSCEFDDKNKEIYQKKIIEPFFLDSTNKQYFANYYGRSDNTKESLFIFETPFTLSDYLNNRESRFPLISIIQMTIDICRSIKLLHENKLVHNHLNDKSIIVCDDNGRKKLLLYNLKLVYANNSNSPVFNEKQEITPFSSPECKQKQTITEHSDVYSIGVLLLYLLHFNGSKSLVEFDSFMKNIESSPNKLETISSKKFRCPKELCELIAKCLSLKDKRISLYQDQNSLLPSLETMKLKFLL